MMLSCSAIRGLNALHDWRCSEVVNRQNRYRQSPQKLEGLPMKSFRLGGNGGNKSLRIHLISGRRVHVGKGARQAGLQRFALTHDAFHGGKLFVVTVEQFAHAVVQFGQLVLVVRHFFGGIVTLHHQQTGVR
jgi:hypothetical protein